MTVYNGLYYNRVTHKCKTCDKTWIFQSHFWGSDVLINIARVCVVAHFIVHHRKKSVGKMFYMASNAFYSFLFLLSELFWSLHFNFYFTRFGKF